MQKSAMPVAVHAKGRITLLFATVEDAQFVASQLPEKGLFRAKSAAKPIFFALTLNSFGR